MATKSRSYIATIVEIDGKFIGYIPEVPGVNSQGDTLAEVNENLREALQMVLDFNREQANKLLRKQKVSKSKIHNRAITVRLDDLAVA